MLTKTLALGGPGETVASGCPPSSRNRGGSSARCGASLSAVQTESVFAIQVALPLGRSARLCTKRAISVSAEAF